MMVKNIFFAFDTVQIMGKRWIWGCLRLQFRVRVRFKHFSFWHIYMSTFTCGHLCTRHEDDTNIYVCSSIYLQYLAF